MLANLLIVQVAEFQDTGHSTYRYREPSRAMSRSPGVVVVDCDPYHHLLVSLLDVAHVVLFQGFDTDYLPLVVRRRAAGKVTLFEFSDDYFDVQPFNSNSVRWVERSVQADLRHFMSEVDAVQFSSPALADQYANRCRRIVTFPNQLSELPPPRERHSGPLTVGWAGTITHLADWFQIAPALQEWLDIHPDVHLAIMSDEVAHEFIRLPPERYHIRPPGSLGDYLGFLRSIDIGLAPLLPTDFGLGRTDLKFLEYAANEVPGIYADVGPFRTAVSHGVTGLLYQDPAGLVRCLDQLADDAGLRTAIAAAARDHVAAFRMIGPEAGRRVEFYRELLGPDPTPVELTEELVVTAIADAHYLRLDRGPPEFTLLDALGLDDPAERVPRLASLTGRYPEYLVSHRTLGQQLNDAGQFQIALRPLEMALAIEPTSARTLLEIGRSRLGAGDLRGGCGYLEAAVRINPHFQPAWRALLGMIAFRPSDTDLDVVDRALALFPDDYMLSLLAARAVPRHRTLSYFDRAVATVEAFIAPFERTAVVTAFSAAATELLTDHLGEPKILEFLQRLSDLLPESARLHDLLGRAYRACGEYRLSCDQFRRAVELRRSAAVYRSEFPEEGTTQKVWLAGEYAMRGHKDGAQVSDG